jgi:hypothetical protein
VWQLQDNQENAIGETLELSIRVGATLTPKPTATTTPTPTPEVSPTPTEQLSMSHPQFASCRKNSGTITWGSSGGPGKHRYFFSSVSEETELENPSHVTGFPNNETYFTTSGNLVFPIPAEAYESPDQHYKHPDYGYEIVWRKTFLPQSACPQ